MILRSMLKREPSRSSVYVYVCVTRKYGQIGGSGHELQTPGLGFWDE